MGKARRPPAEAATSKVVKRRHSDSLTETNKNYNSVFLRSYRPWLPLKCIGSKYARDIEVHVVCIKQKGPGQT